jgi:hypothetical protein
MTVPMTSERKPVAGGASSPDAAVLARPPAAVLAISHELLWDGRLGDRVVQLLGAWDARFDELSAAVDEAGVDHRALLSATWDVVRRAGRERLDRALATWRSQASFDDLLAAVATAARSGITVVLQADTIPAPWRRWLGEAARDMVIRSNATCAANDDMAGDIEFPFLSQCCACQTCTVCPQAVMKDARRARVPALYAGWSLVDRKAALLADAVVAAGPLGEWCRRSAVVAKRFSGFEDVVALAVTVAASRREVTTVD